MIYRPPGEKVQRGSRHEEKTKMSAESESRERKIFIIVRNEGDKANKKEKWYSCIKSNSIKVKVKYKLLRLSEKNIFCCSCAE